MYNRKNTVSSISGARKTEQQCKRMKLTYSLTPYTKINSKWIKNLSVRLDTIKLSEEDIGRTLFDINHSNIFLIHLLVKIKLKKWAFIKFKSFCTAKER